MALVLAALTILPASPFVLQAMAEDEIPVGTAAEFNQVVADLNAIGGSKTVKLTDDISLEGQSQNTRLRKGELTILGEGHILAASLSVLEDGKLNLGRANYDKTLDMLTSTTDLCIVNVDGNGNLDIYNGVTIRDCTRAGQAGGIQAVGRSVVNMYGGTITNCGSRAVSGGVYIDGHSTFNMYDGEITNCFGKSGGAIGLGGGASFGPLDRGPVSFNMYGGTIKDCEDKYIGGGAVCAAYSEGPVEVNISRGTIENCTSSSYGYGAAISFYNTYEKTTFSMTGGTIQNCTAGGYGMGGGICFYYSDTYTTTFPELSFTIDGGSVTGCSCKDTSYGYGGGILLRTPTNAVASVQLKSGLVKGNDAKIGGGIIVFNGPANISDGFGLHNNSATTVGDDIYNNAADVTLGTVDTSATLESCGHPITGWYDDANKRWSYKECTGKDDYLELFTETGTVCTEEYGLKAAHGKLFDVTWKNDDGSEILEEDKDVPEGSSPSYDGDEPTKEETAQYTFTFAGWATEPDQESGKPVSELPAVEDNTTYYAAFSKTPKKYTVTWMSQDGKTELEKDTEVPYGNQPSYDSDEPTKDPTAQYTYTFAGWATEPDQESGKPASELPTVKGNETYYAAFSKTVNKFTVTWMNEDQQLEKDTGVPYGEQPSYDGDEPKKDATAQYTYAFAGWATEPGQESGKPVGELPAVEGDATYYTAFSKTENKYTVTWMNEDTELEKDADVPYGDQPSYDGAEPKKDATAQYTYAFAGWATEPGQESGKPVSELPAVEGDAAYYAAFSKTENKYTVTWMNEDTELEKDADVPCGEQPSYDGAEPKKDATAQYTYAFAGWATEPGQESGKPVSELPAVEGDATYYAAFAKTLREYTVSFDSNGGSDVKDQTIPYGSTASKPDDPTRSGYTFKGWYLDGEPYDFSKPITGDCKLVAEWEKKEEPTSRGVLILTMTPNGQNRMNMKWTLLNDVDGYDLFLSHCDFPDKKVAKKLVKTIKGNKTSKWVTGKVKKHEDYKAVVKAYVMKDGKKTYVKTSNTAHAISTNGTLLCTNVKSIKLAKKKVTLKAGATHKIKATVVKVNKHKRLLSLLHGKKLRYISGDKKIATVSKSGKIKARSAGTCKVYVLGINGVYSTMTITVK